MKAILTKTTGPNNCRPRYFVGIGGDGVWRERFLLRGPWCRSTAAKHAAALQRDLDTIQGYAERLARKYAS